MSDKLKARIYDAASQLGEALKGTYKSDSLVHRCANYIEELGRDDGNFELVFLTALNNPNKAGEVMNAIAEKYLMAFTNEFLVEIEELYSLGTFAEKEQDDE